MALSDDLLWRVLRGTDAGTILLAAEGAGGAMTHEQATSSVDGCDQRDAMMAIGRLEDLGLVAGADYDGFPLTRAGRRLAQKTIQSQTDGPERWDAVQRAMLRFVLEQSPGRAFEVVGELVDGRPVTEDEAELSLDYLAAHGLMETMRTAEADDLRPKVTTKGRYAMHEPHIREYVERDFVSVANDYSTNTNVSGGTVGAVTGGAGNTTTADPHRAAGPGKEET